MVEEGLNQLPYTECTVTTPTGTWEITPGLGRTGSGTDIKIHRIVTRVTEYLEVEGTQRIIESNSLLLTELPKSGPCNIHMVLEL